MMSPFLNDKLHVWSSHLVCICSFWLGLPHTHILWNLALGSAHEIFFPGSLMTSFITASWSLYLWCKLLYQWLESCAGGWPIDSLGILQNFLKLSYLLIGFLNVFVSCLLVLLVLFASILLPSVCSPTVCVQLLIPKSNGVIFLIHLIHVYWCAPACLVLQARSVWGRVYNPLPEGIQQRRSYRHSHSLLMLSTKTSPYSKPLHYTYGSSLVTVNTYMRDELWGIGVITYEGE